jgi:hypothetical protein
MSDYLQYTYPRWLQNYLCWWLWEKFGCRYGWHIMLDEVKSDSSHYLHCDACGKVIHLADNVEAHAPDCAVAVNGRHDCSCGLDKE